jgi:hypothetical protein
VSKSAATPVFVDASSQVEVTLEASAVLLSVVSGGKFHFPL